MWLKRELPELVPLPGPELLPVPEPGMRGMPAVRGAGNNSDLISNSCTISLFTFTVGPPAFGPSSAKSSMLEEKFSPNKSSLFFVTAGAGTGAGTGIGTGAGVGADMGMDTGIGINTGVGLTTGFPSSLVFRSDF